MVDDSQSCVQRLLVGVCKNQLWVSEFESGTFSEASLRRASLSMIRQCMEEEEKGLSRRVKEAAA